MHRAALQSLFPPMHKEGYRFVVPLGVAAFIFFLLWHPLGWIFLVITFLCYLFFRNPSRVIDSERQNTAVAPADGIVSAIEKKMAPAELALGDKLFWRVSIFMSVLNCHVNRTPLACRIVGRTYTPGSFHNASFKKESEKNERNVLTLETQDGHQLLLVQIAGLIARRIVCYAQEDDFCQKGDVFGIIRFGSRVDLYLPLNTEIFVSEGQRTIAGETVIAHLGAHKREKEGANKKGKKSSDSSLDVEYLPSQAPSTAKRSQ